MDASRSGRYARSRRRWLAGRSRRCLGAVGAAVLAVPLVISPAAAVPSTFLELDGNVVSNGTGTFDWANGGALTTTGGTYSRAGAGGVFNGGVFNGDTTPPTAPTRTAASLANNTIADAQFKVDPLASDQTSCGTGDPTVYTGAGSETNGGLLTSDTFGTGSVPPKDDLSNVYAVAHIGNGANEVFFGAERVTNEGASHVDFEFLQSPVTKVGACEGTFTGNRSAGDFLLSVDFTQGGTLGGTTLYEWRCAADSAPTQPADGTVCNPAANGKSIPHYAVTGTPAVVINVNGGTTAIECGGWVCRNSNGTAKTTIAQNELMEGGIDLAQLGFTGCLSTFLPHTRSSHSFTATLKDFEIIPFNTCRSPSVTTSLSGAGQNGPVITVPVGTSVTDQATLVGASPDAGGTVTYTVYTNNACTTGARSAGTKTVTNGVVPASNALAFTSVGTFYWQAVYSGDITTGGRNYGATSPCTDEVLTVAPLSPTIATTLSGGGQTPASSITVPIGTSVSDTATLSGATPDAGGTVTYTVYTNIACTANAQAAGVKTVVNGVVPASNALTFNSAGTFYWAAVYSGDSNNNGVTSPCTAEVLTVSPNRPTIATTLSDGTQSAASITVPIGTSVSDTATLTGATSGAGGTVTYTVYTNSTCTAGARDAGTKTVTNGVVPASNALTFNSAGTFYWGAVYSGDSNNVGVTSPCSAEVLTVSKNTPDPHSTPVVQIKDTLTVTDLTSDATGNVLVGLFTTTTCTAASQIGSNASFPASGNVAGTLTAETSFVAVTAGTYYYKISYAGDNNNTGFVSCAVESVTVGITSEP